jgi:3',5'-cyclic AMP phosphodiesterase CpdA
MTIGYEPQRKTSRMPLHHIIRNTRTVALCSLLVIVILCLLGSPSALEAGQQPFAIIGDTHVGLTSSIYPSFIEAIDRLGITTIVHLGDAVDRASSAAQWTTFEEMTGTGKMLHLVPGNHDVDGSGSLGRPEFRAKFLPLPYYSFSDDDTLFVVLNTELPGQRGTVTGTQCKWAETELQKSYRYKFVFLHRPLFSAVPGHGLDNDPVERDKLHDLFVRTGVSAVFSGHDHVYRRSQKDGVTYIIASGGGGPLYFSAANGGFFHYVIARRDGPEFSFTVRNLNGEVKDHFTLTK